MPASKEDIKFAQVVQKFYPQSTLLRAWDLQGGVSAQVTALEVARPDGQTQKMIVRRHDDVDLRHNPQIAADEFKLLHILQAAGLAVPKPYHLDQSGEIFSTPYVVIEYIEGRTEFALTHIPDLIPQLATHLVRIHALDCSKLDLSFLPAQEKIQAEKLRARPAKLDESLDEGHIRDVLEAAWPLTQWNPSVLLHGDYWAGNILWRDGQIAGIIDWEDARLGDPLSDLATSRLEALWAFGSDAMQSFTDHYASLTTIDFTNLPYWDLCAALQPAFKLSDWAADASAEKSMRDGHRWFITRAFEKLLPTS